MLKGRQPGADCGGLAITRLTFTAGDGTEYELRDRDYGGQPKGFVCSESLGHLRGAVFVTADGTAATFVSDTVIYDSTSGAPRTLSPSGVLKLRDGTTYRIDEGKVTWARDRNGNRVNYTYEGPKVKTITDSLGRVVTINYSVSDVQPYGVCDQIIYKGFGGADRVVRVSRANLGGVLRTARPGDSALPKKVSELFPEYEGSSNTDFNPIGVVAAVWLPDDGVNRRAYRFFYNVYGELARVELPTGGAVEYDFAKYSVSNDGIFRGVFERRVYADGVNLDGRTTYGDGTNPPRTVDSYDAGGVLLARSKHYFHGDPLNSLAQFPTDYAGWREGREYKTEQFGVTNGVASATPIRRVEQQWRQRAPVGWWTGTAERDPANDPRVVETVTTVEPGGANLVTKQSSVNLQTGAAGFDQFNNPTDLWEYDYGAGAAPARPLRHTRTDYLTTNNGVDYTSASGAHLRSLPSGQQVYAVNPSTGAETLAARSETRYDETAYPLLGCGTAENPIPCGSAPQWDDPGTAPRGNATTARRWLDTTNSWVETHAQYDRLGNARYAWDARGGLSEVSYLDSFCNGGSGCGTAGYVPNTFAFATSTKSPKPDPSGAYGSAAELTASTVYDFYTGLAYTAKDANDQLTRFEYGDPLDRLKAVVRPDGGRTDFNYGDAVGNLYVQTLNNLDAGRRTESKRYFDGLGRPYRAAAYENPAAAEPWTHVDTRYDALGRVTMVSMPYRSNRGAAPLDASDWAGLRRTETEYDGLGRAVRVTTRPDGAAVTTAYAGGAVTVTDQAGRKRRSVSDALGRLVRVDEPDQVTGALDGAGGAPVQPTSYTYDAAGSLRKVEQGGQLRFFMYDSLGRLTRARNPEQAANPSIGGTDPVTQNSQWSAAYAYDANGNLVGRTDARDVTTSYVYDGLGRNIITSYTNDPSGTLTAIRKYDFGAGGKGRPYLVAQGGATTSAAYFDKYDAMGRVLVRRQKFETDGEWGDDYTVELEYNPAGGVTKLTYPSGRRVEYRYDRMGRLADDGAQPAFKGTLGDDVERAYASQVLYDELGGVSQERFGTETPVYDKRSYNVRGQLTDIRVSTHPVTSADPGLRTDWNRGAILNHYSRAVWGGSDQYNNGNLRTQQVWVPHDDSIGGWSLFEQTYDYDALNRLRAVTEGGGWRQEFDYDRWGNRAVNAAGTWLGQPSNPPSDSLNEQQFDEADLPNTNRLYAPGDTALPVAQRRMRYDAAGNLIHDAYTGAGARTYDAENRMTAAVGGNGITTSYAYDADGRRARRMAGTAGEVWQVYGAGGELLAEYAKGADHTRPLKEYGYRAGELLVTAEPGPAAAPEAVSWVNAAGVSAAAGSLTKTGAAGWDAGAMSSRALAAGEGSVEFTATADRTDRLCGLSKGDADRTPGDIDFAVYLSDGGFVYAFENGVVKASAGAYVTGDRLRVAVEGGLVKYYKNGAPFYTSAAAPAYPLLVDTALYQTGAALSGVTLQGELAENVAWANASGVSAAGNNLTKTGAGGWTGGASSAQAITAGDGYAEFTAAGPAEDRVFGLSHGDAGLSPGEIDFGIYLSNGGYVYVYEEGVVKANAGAYAAGDRLRVAVEGGAVRYYRNGGLLYTSGEQPAYPLLVDTALQQAGGVISNAVLKRAGQGGGDVRWLVADQLGTPRMVLDRTGTLAGVTRHDYLPFGEELYAGVGGRTPDQGYKGNADGVRKRWALLERDDETGLDYAQARYYSNKLGRFTSPDEFTGGPDELYDFVDDAAANPTFYADIANPQSLNKYQYTYNNPLRYTDPTGHCTGGAAVICAEGAAVVGGSVAGPVGALVGFTVYVVVDRTVGWDKVAKTIGQNDTTCPECQTNSEKAFGRYYSKDNSEDQQRNNSGNQGNNSGPRDSKAADEPKPVSKKEAVREAHRQVGKQKERGTGRLGSPMRGNSKKGYRLDPPHPDGKGLEKTHRHVNWWDYSKGKRGKGGRKDYVPIKAKEGENK